MDRFVFLIFFIAVLSLPAVLLNAADIEDGLWLYLPLNEGVGETVTDYGPNNFETELSETPPKWADSGHNNIGAALEFDGTSNYVKIDMASQGKDIDSHFDTDKGLTICAWIKVLNVATDAHGQTRQPGELLARHPTTPREQPKQQRLVPTPDAGQMRAFRCRQVNPIAMRPHVGPLSIPGCRYEPLPNGDFRQPIARAID